MTHRRLDVPRSGNLDGYLLRNMWRTYWEGGEPLRWIPQPEVAVIIDLDPADVVPVPWPRATDLDLAAI